MRRASWGQLVAGGWELVRFRHRDSAQCSVRTQSAQCSVRGAQEHKDGTPCAVPSARENLYRTEDCAFWFLRRAV